MTLRGLEQQVVLQEQRALDLTLVSSDRMRVDEVRNAWEEARKLEVALRRHGSEAKELVGRLGSVMVELICAEERAKSTPPKEDVAA